MGPSERPKDAREPGAPGRLRLRRRAYAEAKPSVDNTAGEGFCSRVSTLGGGIHRAKSVRHSDPCLLLARGLNLSPTIRSHQGQLRRRKQFFALRKVRKRSSPPAGSRDCSQRWRGHPHNAASRVDCCCSCCHCDSVESATMASGMGSGTRAETKPIEQFNSENEARKTGADTGRNRGAGGWLHRMAEPQVSPRGTDHRPVH